MKKNLMVTMLKSQRDYAHNQVFEMLERNGVSIKIPFNRNPIDCYHNKEHCLDVAWQAMQMSKQLLSGHLLYIVEKQVVIAALFHDAYHSLGKESDSVNVQKSVMVFKDFAKNTNLYLDDTEIPNIEHAILSTEFPHRDLERPIGTSDEVNLISKILCDADIMSSLTPGGIYNSLYGLAKEFGNTDDAQLESYLKFIDMLPSMLKLDINIDWVTKNKETMKQSVIAMHEIISN